jgi:hypothetical protein
MSDEVILSLEPCILIAIDNKCGMGFANLYLVVFVSVTPEILRNLHHLCCASADGVRSL